MEEEDRMSACVIDLINNLLADQHHYYLFTYIILLILLLYFFQVLKNWYNVKKLKRQFAEIFSFCHIKMEASIGLILLLHIFMTDASIYVSDPNRSEMLEFSNSNQRCRIITDGQSIRNVLEQSDPNKIHTINQKMMEQLFTSCTNSDVYNSNGFIFPGTKWCGPGNTATNYNDLGDNSDVDRCCREHDHCPMSLEPGQCRRGICNISPFTRSHCDCDMAFKKCLRDVNSEVARLVATLYFNIAQVTCFKDRRSCPQWMRNDLSYTWFCDEWKFVTVDGYVPQIISPENATRNNEIPDAGKRKPVENSKINDGLGELYRNEEDIEKIMNNPKSMTK